MPGAIDREGPRSKQNEALKSGVLVTMQERYEIGNVRGIKLITDQFFQRLDTAFGGLANVRGKKILDMPCGSETSKESSGIPSVATGEVMIPPPQGYSRLFEPWFCRIVSELGGEAVGLDIGELDTTREDFTYHKVDLGQVGALDFLESDSFDGIQDSRLFGSPEFREQFPEV